MLQLFVLRATNGSKLILLEAHLAFDWLSKRIHISRDYAPNVVGNEMNYGVINMFRFTGEIFRALF